MDVTQNLLNQNLLKSGINSFSLQFADFSSDRFCLRLQGIQPNNRSQVGRLFNYGLRSTC